MSSQQPIAVLGAGGHAKVVIGALRAGGANVTVFDDDETIAGRRVSGVEVQGPIARARELGIRRAVIAVGDNLARKRIAESFQFEWVQVRHPTAWIDPTSRIGIGSVIFAHAVVQGDTEIGDHVIVNTGATVDHDCIVASYAHLAPGVHVGGGVSIGEEALVGVGASIKPRLSIGDKALIGCGAAVVNDVAAGIRVAGVPARTLFD